jgi:hypothetical protein
MVSSAPIQAGTPEATTPGIAPSSVIETDNGQDDLELDAALPSEVALVNEGPTAITQVSAVTPAEIPADLFRAERPGDDQPWWVREGDRRVLAISRTLRSGASVRFPGDVVVYGDVNAGAEIEAGGNIVVLGSLRGLAHAGAQGESEAIVLAFDLRPAQLRISDQIYFPATASKAPGLLSLLGRDRAKTSGFQPMLAMIRSGVIHLEDWRGKLPF